MARSDSSHFRFAAALVRLAVAALPVHAVRASSLEPETVRASDACLQPKLAQMERGASTGKSFLWVDGSRKRLAKVQAG